jgi:hypothetical protein
VFALYVRTHLCTFERVLGAAFDLTCMCSTAAPHQSHTLLHVCVRTSTFTFERRAYFLHTHRHPSLPPPLTHHRRSLSGHFHPPPPPPPHFRIFPFFPQKTRNPISPKSSIFLQFFFCSFWAQIHSWIVPH